MKNYISEIKSAACRTYCEMASRVANAEKAPSSCCEVPLAALVGRVWAACNPCNRSLDILQTSSTLPTSGGAARGCSREIHPIVNVSEFLNNVNYLVPFV